MGLLAGFDVSEVIILVMSEKALDALMTSSTKMGADASIAVGPSGGGAAGTVQADLVSFARSKGVYAGVSLEGVIISADRNANTAYYGMSVTPADILIRKSVDRAAAIPLQQQLAQLSR